MANRLHMETMDMISAKQRNIVKLTVNEVNFYVVELIIVELFSEKE